MPREVDLHDEGPEAFVFSLFLFWCFITSLARVAASPPRALLSSTKCLALDYRSNAKLDCQLLRLFSALLALILVFTL